MRTRKLTRQVAVVVSEELYRDLISITDKEEMALSEYVRNLLIDHVVKIKSGEE